MLDEIAADYDGRLKVGKVDVDAQPELAAAFDVSVDPDARARARRQVVAATKVGAASKDALEVRLAYALPQPVEA